MNSKKSGYSMLLVILVITILVVLGILGVQKAFDAATEAGERQDKTGTRAVVKGYVQGGVEGFQAAIARNADDKALAEAVRDADTGMVAALLSGGANVNARSASGLTPLHRAASRGLVEITRMLIDYGANVNAGSPKSVTPLHLAAGNGQVETVQLLIDSGVNLNPKNDDGDTPLATALRAFKSNDSMDERTRLGYERVIGLLREWGARE
jgi:competence protein ComGC